MNEIAESFAEAVEPVATDYLLTNDPHSGVIRGTKGEVALTEPGMKAIDSIIVVESVANFPRPPAPEKSEIVSVLSGPFEGKWVLVGCVIDNGNYTMTCQASE